MKSVLNRILLRLESIVLFSDYPLRACLSFSERLWLIVKLLIERSQFWRSTTPEIRALLCTEADERVLVPVLIGLLKEKPHLKVSAVIPQPRNLALKHKLKQAGCQVEHSLPDILKPCVHPQNKLALFCLDHRFFYSIHARGVNASNTLQKYGVKTASIQHGGTRKDAVQGLATTASDKIFVWGERVYRELIEQYHVPVDRLRLVGNHLHDRIHFLDRDQILQELKAFSPQFWSEACTKKVILLATCLHTEYGDRPNEAELYQRYMQHLYQQLDFSKVCLVIKMHPADQRNPNLYQTYLPEALQQFSSICMIEPQQTNLDVYALLYISDLLITRASTVAEEALLMNKKVIAFDVDDQGPASAYHHLEQYGSYKTVYFAEQHGLADAVHTALFDPSDTANTSSYDLAREFTYALDGNSLQRTVTELLQQLYS